MMRIRTTLFCSVQALACKTAKPETVVITFAQPAAGKVVTDNCGSTY